MADVEKLIVRLDSGETDEFYGPDAVDQARAKHGGRVRNWWFWSTGPWPVMKWWLEIPLDQE